jgi:hypothetical protein
MEVKKVLKWIGIVFVALIAIGMFMSDDESTSNETSSENTETVQEEASTDDTATVEEDATDEEEKVEEKATEEVVEEEVEVAKNSTYAEYAEYHIPLISEETLELSKVSYDFIVSNNSLFPANAQQDIQNAKNMVDNSITFKHLNKNATPYFNKVLTFSGDVISVEETQIEGTSDIVSLVHVMDEEGNSYQVLLYKTTGDILEDDYVQVWGAPVGPSYFENVSGGTTNVQVFMGSHIEKL